MDFYQIFPNLKGKLHILGIRLYYLKLGYPNDPLILGFKRRPVPNIHKPNALSK